MKRLYILVAAVAMTAASALGQTLRVWNPDGVTSWVYDANALDRPMPFADGGVSIDGCSHQASNGVWMTIDNSDYLADIVAHPDVVYLTGGEAPGLFVTAAGALAPYLTVKVDKELSSYDITVADGFERELTFVLSGSAGAVAIHGNYKTTIVLDGISLRTVGACSSPALWIDNGKRIEFQVKGQNTFADNASNEKKGAFHVKGHAEWKGDGSVSIAGAQRHAYSSNEYTQFKKSFTGTFSVTSAGSDGMHIEQYLQVEGGTINISGNKGDGIDVSYIYADAAETIPTQDEMNGQFVMNGGTITVAATEPGTKGLKCEDRITMTAGRINATASGNGSRGVQTSKDLYLGVEGAADAKAAHIYLTATGGDYEDPETGDVDKCRGLKVKGDFHHYPSTLERNTASTVKAKKIVDVDGGYFNHGGTLTGVTIE